MPQRMLPLRILWNRPDICLVSPDAELLDFEYLPVTSAYKALQELNRRTREFDPNAQLYISGYESELARHVPDEANQLDLFVGALNHCATHFEQVSDEQKAQFRQYRMAGRTYPGDAPRPYYFWAVGPGLHGLTTAMVTSR
jgi:hypothetical protein